jgi:chondroitin-sulfate-ABC endolyase/exolyase
MKNCIIILFIFFCVSGVQSQSFLFEDTTVPAGWVATNGALTLSTEHFKEGAQSLCWEATGSSVINVSFSSFIASTGNSAFMQIYSPEITNDTLMVEFLYYATVKRTANFLCNYDGWREFNRAYTEYASTLSSTISSVRITLKPTTSATRKIYFDNVNFNYTTETNRIVGSQWVLDKAYFTADTSSLALFANPIDIPVTTPTTQELADLNTLRVTLKRTPTAGTASTLAAAKTYVQSINIVRNSDGSVRGNVINTSASALTTTFMTDISVKLEILAAEALIDATTMTLFQNFLDHLLDQGIAEGCNFSLASNNYTPSRTIPASFLNILPVCTATEKVEVLKLVRWMSYYGMMYYPQNTYLANQVSDVVYLFTPHIMGVALFQPDDATAVRDLKAFKRFLERNTEYVPGGGDILKPDGTGFHHGTHYNNYMYCYKTWAEYMYYLKGTQFRISPQAYQRFKKAVISVYSMGTLDTGDTRYNANSLCGRNPFESGMQIQFTKDLFDKLILVGGDYLGTTYDDELAAAYNYFYKTTKYSVSAKNYDGFYQYNYSPTGIYRKANWVATMHAATTKLFGSEIYSGANRFGRYQSHGALEILYSGSLAVNGYPANGTGGGWDWNVIPGATTVFYTSWQEMMPNKTTTDRFDQYTKTKNFSGALSFGDCGMFATDFDQIDTWSSQKFTPTNLTFKKSMYAFDNLIISLGSGISSSGTYDASMITATNLFQNIISSSSGSFLLNGTAVTKPNTTTITTTADNWLITPQGTGYFIPQGNDPIEIRYNDQTTPIESGADYAAPTTTSSAAKAYLNHGVKPSFKSYAFVVVPATNSTAMQTLATQMSNGGGSIFQIQAENSAVHALTYKPLNITAYSFFGAASNLSFGIVKANTAENLLMDKSNVKTNMHYFAICNPDLKPITDATYGWVASSGQTTLTLAGDWVPVSEVSGVVFSAPSGGQTQVTISMSNGDPIYFAVKLVGDTTALTHVNSSDWVQFSKDKENIHLFFSEVDGTDISVRIYSANGQLLSTQNTKNTTQTLDIPAQMFQHGLLVCSVSNGNQTKTYKWIN